MDRNDIQLVVVEVILHARAERGDHGQWTRIVVIKRPVCTRVIEVSCRTVVPSTNCISCNGLGGSAQKLFDALHRFRYMPSRLEEGTHGNHFATDTSSPSQIRHGQSVLFQRHQMPNRIRDSAARCLLLFVEGGGRSKMPGSHSPSRTDTAHRGETPYCPRPLDPRFELGQLKPLPPAARPTAWPLAGRWPPAA